MLIPTLPESPGKRATTKHVTCGQWAESRWCRVRGSIGRHAPSVGALLRQPYYDIENINTYPSAGAPCIPSMFNELRTLDRMNVSVCLN